MRSFYLRAVYCPHGLLGRSKRELSLGRQKRCHMGYIPWAGNHSDDYHREGIFPSVEGNPNNIYLYLLLTLFPGRSLFNLV